MQQSHFTIKFRSALKKVLTNRKCHKTALELRLCSLSPAPFGSREFKLIYRHIITSSQAFFFVAILKIPTFLPSVHLLAMNDMVDLLFV